MVKNRGLDDVQMITLYKPKHLACHQYEIDANWTIGVTQRREEKKFERRVKRTDAKQVVRARLLGFQQITII